MDTAAKFRAVRAQALEDPEVKSLKTKADTTVDAAEAAKALSAYNRALFGKIREIDPSLKSYADKVEQSLNKRIGSEKP